MQHRAGPRKFRALPGISSAKTAGTVLGFAHVSKGMSVGLKKRISLEPRKVRALPDQGASRGERI